MAASADPIFSPLVFRNLTVKNRLFRSSISGRIDNYDGSGTQARINWEERFARGGVGAIISAHVPIDVSGRVLPNYAHIDADDKVPFWRALGDAVHAHGCAFLLQLSHGGRQQDIAGVENDGRVAMSSTSRADAFHGLPCRAMTRSDIATVVGQFAAGARRAREAGLDGVELHACNGYLFTQFLSSAINDRDDDYGGSLRNRARFLLEVIGAIRDEVGPDFHLQVKISAVEANDAVVFWDKRGNTLDESVEVCRWAEEAGADAIHVSYGGMFPHPNNPAGDFPVAYAMRTYDIMVSSGRYTFRNFLLFRNRLTRPLMRFLWNRTRVREVEGMNVDAARAVKQAVGVPVLVTGGFQTASYIRGLLQDGVVDGVTLARPLMANPDLPRMFEDGLDHAPRPCTYCNKCLYNVLEHPLGCYDERRFDGDREAMLAEVLAFYRPDGFGGHLPTVRR